MDYHCLVACEEIFTKLFDSYNPDVIVSVHPNLNLVPVTAARKIGKARGKHVPFFTVVTDLGSGHCGK